MRRRIFNSGILLLILVLILPACSKKKEPAPSAGVPEDIQKKELPELPQNKIVPNPFLSEFPPNLSFEEASGKTPPDTPSDSLGD